MRSWDKATTRLKHWLLVGLLPLVLLSCSHSGDEREPIAQSFLAAYHSKDFAEAIRYVSDSSRQALRILESDLSKMPFHWPDSLSLLPFQEANDTLLYLSYLDSIADTLHLVMLQERKTWRIAYERNDPIHAARSFLEAFHRGRFKEAAKFVSPNSMRDLEVAALYYQSWQGPDIQIQSVQLNEGQNKAVVSYREKGNTLVKRISLLKVKGYWKVSFGKEAQW